METFWGNLRNGKYPLRVGIKGQLRTGVHIRITGAHLTQKFVINFRSSVSEVPEPKFFLIVILVVWLP